MAVWVVIFFGLGMFPALAARLGLAATAVLGIGALTGMVSAMGLIMQPHAPAEAFRLLGFKRTPLVTVLAVIVVLVTVLSGKGTIHEMDRGSATGQVDSRKTMAEAFKAWSTDPGGCEVTVAGRRVRPMLLVAAEGGGIRAAYWTVRGLEAMGEYTCAGRSVLFSAGASGGSVGLTVARFSGTATDPGITRAVEAIQQMAGPGTLSEAADGTFIRDTFYGATGVPMPLLPSRTRAWQWADRARLIETGWQDAYQRPGRAWGDRSFLNDQDLSPATGHLILNSTDAKHVCRVWVSQIKPDPSAHDHYVSGRWLRPREQLRQGARPGGAYGRSLHYVWPICTRSQRGCWPVLPGRHQGGDGSAADRALSLRHTRRGDRTVPGSREG